MPIVLTTRLYMKISTTVFRNEESRVEQETYEKKTCTNCNPLTFPVHKIDTHLSTACTAGTEKISLILPHSQYTYIESRDRQRKSMIPFNGDEDSAVHWQK